MYSIPGSGVVGHGKARLSGEGGGLPAWGFAAHPVEEGVAFGRHSAGAGEAVDCRLCRGDVDGVVLSRCVRTRSDRKAGL